MRVVSAVASLIMLFSVGRFVSAGPGVQEVRPNPAARTGTGVIRGRVLGADTGQPLRQAWVRLAGLPAGIPGETPPFVATDDQGRYEFTALPPGRFTVSAGTTSQYVNLSYGQRRPSDPARPIDLAAGQTLDNIDFILPRGGFIVVQVNDDLGDPVAGAQVTMTFGSTELRSSLYEIATTNDLGEAVSRPLPTGDYFLLARTDVSQGSRPAPIGASNSKLVYAPTYFPGTRQAADAQSVHVSAGQEARVSYSLATTRTASISGVVRAANGSAPVRPMVSLRPTPRRITLQPDGSFTIENVLPGEYTIVVGPTASDQLSTPEHAQFPVTLSGEDITNLVVTTSRSVSARGRLNFEGGPPPNVRPSAFFVRTMGASSQTGLVGGGLTWNPDWTFELRGVWGAGLVRVSSSATQTSLVSPETIGWFLKSVTLDGKDITDTPVNFGGSDITGLEILLTQKRTEVAGAVTDTRGGAVADYVAVLFPEDRDQWTAQSRFIASARSDKDGRFKILGLPPGRYFAVAVDSLEAGEERDPNVLTRLQTSATRVTLAEGESRTINLRLVN